MNIQILSVPYDTGHCNERMGRGPSHLLENGIADSLASRGHQVGFQTITSDSPFLSEIGTAFELKRKISENVHQATSENRFPLVLAGNCNASVGVMAGIGSQDTGIIWFDGHGDFNTPETTTTGYLDGMGLAVIAGLCWKSLAATIPGFRPISPQNAILAGARDLDQMEENLLKQSGVAMISVPAFRENGVAAGFESALNDLAERVGKVHVHIDLDILDPKIATASHLAPPGGLTFEELEPALSQIAAKFTVRSGALTAYEPEYDPDGRALEACKRILAALAAAAQSS